MISNEVVKATLQNDMKKKMSFHLSIVQTMDTTGCSVELCLSVSRRLMILQYCEYCSRVSTSDCSWHIYFNI